MITLTYASTTVALHPDLMWSDEHSWLPVEQSVQRTVTGAMIVSASARLAGRPITLQPDGADSAWMSVETLDALRNLAVVPGRQMTLTLRGQTYSVIFRHHDGVAIDATPVVHFNDRAATDWYQVTLRFMEI